jgi:tetratricopeptide (TPR) repeat protein
MKFLQGRWIRFGLFFFLGLVTAAGGFLAFWAHNHSVQKLLDEGEAACSAGTLALDARDAATARLRFQEASLYADNCLQRLEQQRQELKDATPETAAQQRMQEGAAFWLKARALRGQGFAKVLQDGQPIYTHDSTDDRDILDLTRIADEKLRTDAMISLREAALRLTTSEPVLREAVRVEMQGDVAQWNWPLAESFAGHLLTIATSDPRALYLLARYHYEQPAVGAGKGSLSAPSVSHKRSRERMLKARDYLTTLKQMESTPRWRTLHLEVQIGQWLVNHYRQPQNPKPELEKQEREKLRTLLFDPEKGALARAERDEHIAKSSRLDAEGVLALHMTALQTVLEDLRKGETAADDRGRAQRLQQLQLILVATIGLGERLTAERDAGASRLSEVAETWASVLRMAQPFVALENGREWGKYVEAELALVQRVADKKAGSLALYFSLGDLLAKEAELADHRGQSSRVVEMRKLAVQWVETGLKVGQARKQAALPLLALHDLAARLKMIAGAQRAEMADHLKALKDAAQPGARAAAYLLEGALAEREGRLEKARDHLERALQLAGGPVAVRAQVILANVYLALGQCDQALTSLREVERIYAGLEKLSSEEKTWVQEFIRSPQELMLMQIQAHLGAVKMLAVSRQPKEQIVKIAATHEEEARKLLAKLPEQSPTQRAARLELANYLAATGRSEQAEKELAALKRDFPESLPVLRLEIGLLMQSKKDETAESKRSEADRRIRQFISDYTQNVEARLFWAEWLLATGRATQAAAYLEDSTNFPDGKEDRQHQRLLARAFLGAGERDKVQGVLNSLPSETAKNSAMVYVAGSAGSRETQPNDALARHESTGLTRCWNAGMAYSRRDFAEAARAFVGALDYSRFRQAAQQGLRQSLLALALDDPAKARDLTVELLQEHPGEPSLLFPYAYTCLLLDELGNPAENGDRIKDMCSALNALEMVLAQSGADPAAGPVTKAQFWVWCNRPDRARTEVLRALKQNPKYEAALWLAARLAIDASDPALIDSATQYIAVLRELQPESVEVQLLAAQQQARSNKPAEAIKSYETILAKNPASTEAHAGFVAVLERQGETDKALEAIGRWRKQAPESLPAVMAQIRVMTRNGNVTEAHLAAERYLAERTQKNATRQFGSVLLASADQVESQDRQKVAATQVRVQTALALAEAFIQSGAWAESEEWLQGAFKDQPDCEAARLLLGNLYIQQLLTSKDTPGSERPALAAKARDAYFAVYNKHKGHLIAGNNLAWLLARECGDPEEALRIAREVRLGRYSQKPLSGDRLPLEFLDTFGQVYRAVDKPELAGEMRDLFETAKQRYPNDPRVYFYLGHAYSWLQNPRKADLMFGSAIALAGTQNRSTNLSSTQRQRIAEAAQTAQQKLKMGSGQ